MFYLRVAETISMIEENTDDLSGCYALVLYAVSDPLSMLALSV